MKIHDYEVTEKLYESSKVVVYRVKDSNSQTKILKVLRSDHPKPTEIQSIQLEFEILKKIDSPNVVKVYGLEKQENKYFLVEEDIQGVSIDKYYGTKSFTELEFLDIAIQATNALNDVHEKNIIHKDIKPQNFVINSQTKQVKLIDFDNASLLSRENPSYTTKMLEGTLYYVSPELTGRMNRTVDSRSDLYSLGVSFYEILTGTLPFEGQDALEIIHQHLAVKPVNPIEKNPHIPEMLSIITMKLLEKLPEERYQEASGLLEDLLLCKTFLQEKGHIPYFQIKKKDLSKKFYIPEKIYGREKEIKKILSEFKEVAQGNKKLGLSLLAGISGLGKSVLAGELHKPIVKHKGLFTNGKFDQYANEKPFSAFLQALEGLIQQLLTEEKIAEWRIKISQRLGENAQLIIQVLPELELILGPQPPVAELPPQESANRFFMVFSNFIKAFASKSNPLVIFLDDLQWGDPQSVKLLSEFVFNSDLEYCHLICSYRDNELVPTHPFAIFLENLEKQTTNNQKISLEPLTPEIVSEILSDTLHSDPKEHEELSKLIYQKTKGNPFFISSFLKRLYSEGYLFFDSKSEKWKWDFESIQKLGVTENVVDFLSQRLKHFNSLTLEFLQILSCLGTQIDISLIKKLTEKEYREILSILEIPVQEGIILASEKSVKFSHDKMREAVYETIPKEKVSEINYFIGKKLYSIYQTSGERIFDIVEHLNLGLEHVLTHDERKLLINLNILAANKAKSSSAFEISKDLFKKALEISKLENPNIWNYDSSLASQIFLGLAQTEYLTRNYESAENYFEEVLKNTKDILEKVQVNQIRIALYSSLNKYMESLQIGLDSLKLLGVEIPQDADQAYLIALFQKIMESIGARPIEDLLNLPTMSSEEKKAIISLFVLLTPAAYMASPNLLPILAFKIVEFSLEYGNTNLSSYGYCLSGMILGSGFGNYELGDKFGKLALSLLEKLQSKQAKCNTLFLFASMIVQWKNHAREGLEIFLQGVQSGLSEGDLQFASYNLIHHNYRLFFVRENLFSVLDKVEKYKSVILDLKQLDSTYNYFMWAQTIKNLSQPKHIGTELTNEYFQETSTYQEWLSSRNSSSLYYYYLAKLILNYMNGNYLESYRYARLADSHVTGAFGMMHVPEMKFWDSLAILKLLAQEKEEQYFTQLESNLATMKTFHENCEANFSHKYYLLLGELKRIEKKYEEAFEFYNKCIQLAKRYEYILEEALAQEGLLDLWIERNHQEYAIYHLDKAFVTYEGWGCQTRVHYLKNRYTELYLETKKFSKGLDIKTTSAGKTTTKILTSPTLTTQITDMQSMLKSVGILSSEIQLSNLISKFMKVLIENAGAEKGILLLTEESNHTSELKIKAISFATKKEEETLQDMPISNYSEISHSIIRYVQRTMQDIILDSAISDRRFNQDEYIQKTKLKSVVCLPIVLKTKFSGIIYLENNLAVGSFTQDRVSILKALTAQASISIENSKLYTRLINLNENLQKLNSTYEKFVPKEFLNLLEKSSITEIKLGDNIQKDITVLFSDIRSFTSISEKMSPKENFDFLNSYLKKIGPIIRLNGGFIDKYIGDAIMALFPLHPENALKAALQMKETLVQYNQSRVSRGYEPIQIGIGIHHGSCMLGTIGEEERMEGTVISDTVNLASRLENLTKVYNSNIIVSETFLSQIPDISKYNYRILDRAKVKGKSEPVVIYEILVGYSQEELDLILKTKPLYEKAFEAYSSKNFDKASFYFRQVLAESPNDGAAKALLNKSEIYSMDLQIDLD